MKQYAGVGARATPHHILEIMYRWGIALANAGYVCNTGAAEGADQAFANGASSVHGPVALYLPWTNFNLGWQQELRNTGTAVSITVLNPYERPDCIEAAYRYRTNLKQSHEKLHGRNYLIIENTEFVICWSPSGQIVGGTGMAISFANELGIKVYNLGNPETFTLMTNRLIELGY